MTNRDRVNGGERASLEAAATLTTVLGLIRSRGSMTRPELVRASGLGRNVVTQRVAYLIDRGLVEEAELATSTGGRAARVLRLGDGAGRILAAEVGATSLGVAVTDLSGEICAEHEEPADVTHGPDVVLGRLQTLFAELLASLGEEIEVWGVGVGLPGPVEFATGRPTSPPIMPGWDAYPVREVLGARFAAPVWIDNDVNVMALGEHRLGVAQGHRDFLYLKVGTGIGAGLFSHGRLHRGAQGGAGDIGHVAVTTDAAVICRCGNVGCLEALAGGAALAAQGRAAAEEGRSAHLRTVLEKNGAIESADVGVAASFGDPVALELLTKSGRLVGEMLARMVNFFNPSLVVLGGGVLRSGDFYLAAVKEVVFRRSLPLATRDLVVTRSPLGQRSGVMGAAGMVVDELFAPARLNAWLYDGAPAGRPELAELPSADL
jgi:glucokinase-like ROK family protein